MVVPPEKEHCLRIVEQVHHFFTQQSLCDLTIHVQDEEFHLHRLIFAAVCPLLYNLVTKSADGSQSGHLTLKLHGLSSSAFRLLLDFIYTGRAPEESQTNLRNDFVKACCAFKIPFPRVKFGEVIWLSPKDDVQMALLPKNEMGVIEVVLQQFSGSPQKYDEASSSSLGDFTIGPEILNTSEIRSFQTKLKKEMSQEPSQSQKPKSQDDQESKALNDEKEMDFEEVSVDSSTAEDHSYSFSTQIAGTQEIPLPEPSDVEFSANVALEEKQQPENIANNEGKFSKDYKVHLDLDIAARTTVDDSKTSEPQNSDSEKKVFRCRKCQSPLPEVSIPASALLTNHKEVRYHCKPCGKWYITLRKGAITPETAKSKNVVRHFLASVNGKPIPTAAKKQVEVVSKDGPDVTKPEASELRVTQQRKSIVNPAPLKYKCDQCSCAFTRRDVLRQHIKDKHADGANETSEAVSTVTVDPTINPNKPKKERPYECDICFSRFTRKHSMEEHKRQLHGKVKQIVFCEMCNKKYTSVKSFNMHCHTRHPNGEVPRIRPPARIRTPKKPKEPKKEKKNSNKPVKDPSSVQNKKSPKSPLPAKEKKDAIKKSRYENRKKKISDGMPHEQLSPFYECPICLARYKKQIAFFAHVTKCKNSIKFKCDQCPQGFKTKRKRAEHMWSVHHFDEALIAKSTNTEYIKHPENNSQWYNETVQQVQELQYESGGSDQ